MYKKVDSKLVHSELEKNVLQFWDNQKIFEKVTNSNPNSKAFVFYDGPPGVNGKPHIGHVSNRIYKDIILRYKTMQGFRVLRKAGWDAHGLPVELQAEKELNFKNKQDIEKFGLENFVNKCKSIVSQYREDWSASTRKIGYWVDLEKAYITCSDKFIESVWWSLDKLFKKGLIYKGYKVMPYCPRCGTSLSTHEMAQGYQTVKDKTLYVRFKLKNESDTYFLAWTTTPWTLPSNVALAVNPDIEYSQVNFDGTRYILASNLIEKVLPESKIEKTFIGKDLENTEYLPIYDMSKIFKDKKGYYVTCADFVTTTDGTGIVHIAPAFGADDNEVGRVYDLPFVQLVDEQGCFTADLPKFEGKRNIEVNELVVKELMENGTAIIQEEVEHEYPHCWRCHTPLLYYARSGWFIEMSKFRNNLVKNNNAVNFIPENVKDGRMGNFVANATDWNLSRNRFWGTPLNIWECQDCQHCQSIGSKAELEKLSGQKFEFDLHRPYVDNIEIKCEKCGGKAFRVPELIDCWYDSGAMPFAQWHYPFENQEIFEDQFPADFICEAQDQTRGWFYTLQAISTLMFDTTPYKNCMVAGLVLDKNGCKMSKSAGNVINPNELIEQFGADSVRWFFAENSVPWANKLFDPEYITEAQRKIIGTLWNTYSFFVLYANIDKFDRSDNIENCKLSIMDKWILSEFNSMLEKSTKLMDNYNFTDTARLIDNFVEGLSNWYIRRSRERFWASGETEDKTSAFTTLYYILFNLVKVIAPITPFLAEEIYQNLRKPNDPISIHLCSFPKADLTRIDTNLEDMMDNVIKIVTLGRAVRAKTAIKNRQPLNNIYVYSVKSLKLDKNLKDIICQDLNVKNLEIIHNTAKYISFELKPQLKTLGPKYGKNLKLIISYLSNCNADDLVEKLNQGAVKLEKDGVEFELTKDDVLIYPHSKPHFSAQQDNGITVILDTELTSELIEEGIMREVVSKLQNLRKEANYEVEDKIEVGYIAHPDVKNVIEKFKDTIRGIILANSINEINETESNKFDITKQIEINEMLCTFSLIK
jgi:isoleucyl-tRNA synthetase